MFGLDMSAIRNVFTFHVCHCHLTAVRVQRKKTLMPLLHLSSCDIAAGPHPPASAFSPILSLPCWPFLLTDGSGPAGHHASRSCPAGHHRRSPRRFPRGGRDPQLPRTSIPPPSPPARDGPAACGRRRRQGSDAEGAAGGEGGGMEVWGSCGTTRGVPSRLEMGR